MPATSAGVVAFWQGERMPALRAARRQLPPEQALRQCLAGQAEVLCHVAQDTCERRQPGESRGVGW